MQFLRQLTTFCSSSRSAALTALAGRPFASHVSRALKLLSMCSTSMPSCWNAGAASQISSQQAVAVGDSGLQDRRVRF